MCQVRCEALGGNLPDLIEQPTDEQVEDDEEDSTEPWFGEDTEESSERPDFRDAKDAYDRVRGARQKVARWRQPQTLTGKLQKSYHRTQAAGRFIGARGRELGQATRTAAAGARTATQAMRVAGQAIIAAARLAAQAVGALISSGPVGWIILGIIILIVIIIIGILVIYSLNYAAGSRTPNYPDQANALQQEDKLEFLDNIQDPDAKRLRIIQETKVINQTLIKAKTSAKTDQDRQKIDEAIKKATELITSAENLADPEQKTSTEDVQKIAKQFADLYRQTLPISFPGNRLPVEWFTQPIGSRSCNYWAAYMAARYVAKANGLDTNKVKSPTEINQCFLDGTKGYFTVVLKQAGLTNFEVVRGSGFPAGNTQDKNTPWGKIYDELVNKKNPVVVATGFSKTQVSGGCAGRAGRPSHFLVIVGFSDDGQMAYVNDSGSRLAKDNSDPLAKNANRHLLNDPYDRWRGRYCEYYYVKKI